jgi:hypothetical protein
MKELATATFISGDVPFYTVIREFPSLSRIPMEHYDTVKKGLHRLGYRFRIRYRGPRSRSGEARKATARAFTVYFQQELI